MRQLIALSFIVLPFGLQAQNKNNIFTDVGYSTSYSSPGISATYSRKISPRLGLGAGVQVFNDAMINRVKKTAYIDLRVYRYINKSLLFFHGDAGVNFSQSYKTTFTSIPGKTFFSGFGFGYGYMINKRGMGPYASMKFLADTYTAKSYYPTNPAYEGKVTNMDGTFVFSVGFKF